MLYLTSYLTERIAPVCLKYSLQYLSMSLRQLIMYPLRLPANVHAKVADYESLRLTRSYVVNRRINRDLLFSS